MLVIRLTTSPQDKLFTKITTIPEWHNFHITEIQFTFLYII